MQDEGRTAGERAPGLANDSLGDTQNALPELERESEEERRAEVRDDAEARGDASEGERDGDEDG